MSSVTCRTLRAYDYRTIAVSCVLFFFLRVYLCWKKCDSADNALNPRKDSSSRLETLEINENARVAQIRRKTDYLRGGASPSRKVFSLTRRESITRPLTARSNFTRREKQRNESEKRSLIFIVAIMDFFITRFEKRKRGSGQIKREIDTGGRMMCCINSGCWICFCNFSEYIIYELVNGHHFSLPHLDPPFSLIPK